MATCAGCLQDREVTERTLDEPNPDGDGAFVVEMCEPCWEKYDGPDGDQFAWGW